MLLDGRQALYLFKDVHHIYTLKKYLIFGEYEIILSEEISNSQNELDKLEAFKFI